METVVLGDGGLGRAIETALRERGDAATVIGRPAGATHEPRLLEGAEVAFEASRGEAVLANVRSLLDAGVRRIVIGTTAWDADRDRVETALREAGAAAVAASNLSLGVALFGRLVDAAVALYGSVPGFDPYLVEWHRRGKADRPSGTARALAARIVAAHPRVRTVAEPTGASSPDTLEVIGVRAGANPGSHLVGFDAPGETIELRCTARDRTAYAAGALAAADWLRAGVRTSGLHPFDEVVDELILPGVAMAR